MTTIQNSLALSLQASIWATLILFYCCVCVGRADAEAAKPALWRSAAERSTEEVNPNPNATARDSNCVAGGSGYGLFFDYTRKADVVSLHWKDIPQHQITVEFWFKNTDTFLQESCVFSYSAFNARGYQGQGQASEGQQVQPYLAPNEVSMRISRQRWSLWRGGGSECELHADTNPLVEQSYVDGKWHHYAFSIDADTKAVALYLDGHLLDFGTTYIYPGKNITDTSELISSASAVEFQTLPFSNDWNIAESPDAHNYFGHIHTQVIYAEAPCEPNSYEVCCV